MLTFEKTVIIDRPHEEVFDFVSDPANDARYRSGACSAEWTSDNPVGVGSTMRTVDRFMGREVETVSRITAWDPPHHYAFETAGGSFPTRFTLTFEPVGDGTRLISRGEIGFKGILKVVEWLFDRQIKAQVERDFVTLKRLLEAS